MDKMSNLTAALNLYDSEMTFSSEMFEYVVKAFYTEFKGATVKNTLYIVDDTDWNIAFPTMHVEVKPKVMAVLSDVEMLKQYITRKTESTIDEKANTILTEMGRATIKVRVLSQLQMECLVRNAGLFNSIQVNDDYITLIMQDTNVYVICEGSVDHDDEGAVHRKWAESAEGR